MTSQSVTRFFNSGITDPLLLHCIFDYSFFYKEKNAIFLIYQLMAMPWWKRKIINKKIDLWSKRRYCDIWNVNRDARIKIFFVNKNVLIELYWSNGSKQAWAIENCINFIFTTLVFVNIFSRFFSCNEIVAGRRHTYVSNWEFVCRIRLDYDKWQRWWDRKSNWIHAFFDK